MTLRYDENSGFATANLAVYMLFRRGNQAAFILRQNTGWMDGHYALPGGRVDHGESYTIAAVREAKEEVAVDIRLEDLVPAATLQRHFDDGDWSDMLFEVTKWQGEPTNAEPEKHSELAWLDLDDLPENIIPELKYTLEQLAEGKKLIEIGWEETV